MNLHSTLYFHYVVCVQAQPVRVNKYQLIDMQVINAQLRSEAYRKLLKEEKIVSQDSEGYTRCLYLSIYQNLFILKCLFSISLYSGSSSYDNDDDEDYSVWSITTVNYLPDGKNKTRTEKIKIKTNQMINCLNNLKVPFLDFSLDICTFKLIVSRFQILKNLNLYTLATYGSNLHMSYSG